MSVPQKEIVQALTYVGCSSRAQAQHELAMRIESEGIAPPEGYAIVPVEPTDAMIDVGGHVNSEWLNDNAPLGESRYQLPIIGIYKAMLTAAKESL